MVGMVDVFVAVEPALGVARQDRVRFELPDETRELLAQGDGMLELTIGIALKVRLHNPQDPICREV